MERELADYEGKLSEEEKKDREKNEKRMNALQKRKDDLIKDKKKKQEVGFNEKNSSLSSSFSISFDVTYI